MKSNEAYDRSIGNPYFPRNDSTTTTVEGYYDPYSGNYSGTSTTKQQDDYIADFVDIVARGMDAKEAYELCMKSKGYYQVEKESMSPRTAVSNFSHKGRLDSSCSDSLDCAAGYYCNNGRCKYYTTNNWGDPDTQFRLAGKYISGEGVPKDINIAVTLLQKAAEQGHIKANGALGELYFRGQGVKKDYQKALELSKIAAVANMPKAKVVIGMIYRKGGYGVTKDLQTAITWLLQASKSDKFSAQMLLSETYLSSKEYKSAVKWFKVGFSKMPAHKKETVFTPASEAKIEFYSLLSILADDGVNDAAQYRDKVAAKFTHTDKVLAKKLLTQIQLGLSRGTATKTTKSSQLTVVTDPVDSRIRILNIKAKYKPSLSLPYGDYHVEVSKKGYNTEKKWISLKQSKTEISIILHKVSSPKTVQTSFLTNGYSSIKLLSEQGDTDALYHLGWLYYLGETIKKDSKRANELFKQASGKKEEAFAHALKWLHQLAINGDTRAQFFFITLYLKDGTYIDKKSLDSFFELIKDKNTFVWSKKAAVKGDPGAQALLALYYYEGESGVNKNMKSAFDWATKAAMQGSFAGQYLLGILYKEGKGILQNNVISFAWLSLAAIGGDEDCIEERDLLSKKLSNSDKKQGLEIASELQKEIASNRFGEKKKFSKYETDKKQDLIATGTAFVISSNGYIVTCFHVIDGASKITISINDSTYPAKVIRSDKINDVAVLKIEGTFSALSFPPKNTLKMGDYVFTVGYPNPSLQGVNQKLTEGIISSLTGYQDDIRLYQISTPVQPGNSGGPLIDKDGNVVGIVIALLREDIALKVSGSLPQNVNYALKSYYVEALVDTVPDAVDHFEQSNNKGHLGNLVERVKKSVVMVKAYK